MRRILITLAGLLSAPPLGATQEVTLRVTERGRFGDLSGPMALTRVVGAGMREGLLYLGQPQERLVRVIDREGRLVREFGRAGRGPGEFATIDALGLRGDEVVVLDRGNDRLTVFSTAGEHLRSSGAGGWFSTTTGFSWLPWHAAPDSAVIYLGSNVQAHLDRRPDSTALIVVGYEGNPIDTLLSFVPRDRMVSVWTDDGRNAAFPRAAHTGQRMAFSPDGVTYFNVDGSGDRLAIQAQDTRTMEVRTLEFDAPPVRVPKSWADSITDAHVRGFEETGASQEFVSNMRRAYALPEAVPRVAEVAAVSADELWLSEPSFDPTPVLWRVVNLSKKSIGLAELPAGVQVLAREGTVLWGIARDELGVPSLVRFDVEPIG